ncbi:PIN domain-containing protein [Aquibium carbonis]|uniref:Ribonuclease VapC n=1 Tax=Aquibium carbonis TaxID=2495581 RepID=A0A3S0A307_9HYPH|nr:type II toxin-antitoxin system VapC family toxin [Aquibium carbonis]RST82821.1 PIN domain-containing protein [Aquibium carbonis]
MQYLDTSVLVAMLTNEDATARVHTWIADQPVGRLAVSEWVHTEFASALALKVRTGQITVGDRAAIVSGYTRIIHKSFRVYPVSADHFRSAALHLGDHELGLRAGDALHIAIAFAEGATLCTLDRRMAAAASALGLRFLLL